MTTSPMTGEKPLRGWPTPGKPQRSNRVTILLMLTDFSRFRRREVAPVPPVRIRNGTSLGDSPSGRPRAVSELVLRSGSGALSSLFPSPFLVLAEPQQLLKVFHPLLDRPAPIICLDEVWQRFAGKWAISIERRFSGEFETPVGTIAYWPKTVVFGQSLSGSKNPLKSIVAMSTSAQGFWPVVPVAHFLADRCHGSG